jgi:serine/threonine-protein kinase
MPPQGYGQDPMRLRPPMPAGGAGAFHQPKSSGGAKWVFIILGLLVVAGLVVGAIFLFSDGGSGGGGTTTAPNIPVGPGDSQANPTSSLNAPPTSISIKPGN